MRLIHLTDCHLFADPSARMKSVDTADTLLQVIDLAGENEPSADAFILTGDLSQDETKGAYKRLSDAFIGVSVPVYALKGNHDDEEQMGLGFMEGAGSIRMPPHVEHGPGPLVVLDSTVPGEVGGRLSELELTRLSGILGARPDLHTLVCLHHQPLPVGSKWIDSIGLVGGDDLFDVLENHANGRAVLFGHVHQEVDVMHRGVRVLSSPSTCIQFTPGAEDFALEQTAPGYRWLELGDDGQVETGVRRVEKVPAVFDDGVVS